MHYVLRIYIYSWRFLGFQSTSWALSSVRFFGVSLGTQDAHSPEVKGIGGRHIR